MSEIDLHIGTHKTGSTAFQGMIFTKRAALADCGIGVVLGRLEPAIPIELYVAAMDPARESHAKMKYAIDVDDRYVRAVAADIAAQVGGMPAQRWVASCEGLSLLRSPAELERLRILLGDLRVRRVVLVTRAAADYLGAFRAQIRKTPGRMPSLDPASNLYVEPDSWLADYDALHRAYAEAFGAEVIVRVDYDREMAAHNDVLPAMIDAMELPREVFGNLARYRANRTTPLARLRQHVAKAAHALHLR